MLIRLVFWIALVAVGCSSPSVPTAPSPVPASSRVTVSGTITDTATGARVGSFSQEVERLPAVLTITHNGYVSRHAWVTGSNPTIDLFPEQSFDLSFYRQLARGTLDGRMDALRVWSQSPSIYLQRAGLSDATVAALERAARETVPALTGGRFRVEAWETGQERRSARAGWIVVELANDATALCGRAVVGGGEIWLNQTAGCTIEPGLFAHELGHGLGFWHVQSGLMAVPIGRLSSQERQHAAFAYARQRGNQDVDVDPAGSAAGSAKVVMERLVID